ncbi:discoidin domain-containing protein [Streptomyces sp. NPDC087297]|uniref:discoidin domain-containing protein n=1 Tax=Streptomyces sp. NPDC087297 TaxID=3365778 RepID=UPI0037F30019
MAGSRRGRAASDVRAGLVFVGRREELRSLVQALRVGPSVVLVKGEAGIGKSRLLREATGRLESATVMWGGCHPLREPLPFGPVIDALRSADLHIDSQAKLSAATAALAPYLPAVAWQLPKDERGTADPETGGDAQRLMRAVHELLGVLGPVVLVVEDLHWVDEATRDLLLLLARNPPQHLRLVLTYRAEDLPEHGNALGAPYRRPVGVGGTEITLSPFTESEVRELAVSVIGPAAATALGGRLFERSQGLPLVAEEDLLTVADRLARSPADGAKALEDMGVPRALQEALNSRIAVLAPEAVAVVQAAAVLAVPATEELLAALAGLEEAQAEAGLEAALEASVLSETSPGWYGFRHVLARRAVYDKILGPRRRRLHRRAVDALSDEQPPPLVRIAHHTRQLGDTRAWLPRALAAADQAVAVGDDGIATDLLQQLLAEASLPVEDRTRTALSLARIAVNRADPTASVALLEHILADPALPTPTLGEIRLSLGRIATTSARSTTAGLERAVGELAGRPDLAAVAMATLGMRVVSDVPAAEGLAWMDRALETVALTIDPVAHATVLASRITLRISTATLTWEAAYAKDYDLRVSTDGTTWTTVSQRRGLTGPTADQITFPATDARYVRMQGIKRGTAYGYSLYGIDVRGAADLAAGKPATASSSETPWLTPELAFDNNGATRWSSERTDNQWLQVDLGSAQTVSGASLTWEVAYAKDYDLQVSTDGTTWTTVSQQRGHTAAGTDNLTFTPTDARYVRMQGIKRGTGYGYSLYNLRLS